MQFARAGLRDPELIRLDVERKISEKLKVRRERGPGGPQWATWTPFSGFLAADARVRLLAQMGFFLTRPDEKIPLACFVLRELLPRDQQTIVFVATRHHVELLSNRFAQEGLACVPIYGSMDLIARRTNLSKFRNKKAMSVRSRAPRRPPLTAAAWHDTPGSSSSPTLRREVSTSRCWTTFSTSTSRQRPSSSCTASAAPPAPAALASPCRSSPTRRCGAPFSPRLRWGRPQR